MPGFTGVGAGRWTVPSPVPVPVLPDIYLVARTVSDEPVFWLAMSDGTFVQKLSPLGLWPLKCWSLGTRSNLSVFEGGDPCLLHVSDDAGDTWADPVELAIRNNLPDFVLSLDDMYRLADDGSVQRALNGTDWATIDPGPWANLRVGRVRAFVAQIAPEDEPRTVFALADGGGGAVELGPGYAQLFSQDGGMFGPSAATPSAGMLFVHQDDPSHVTVWHASAVGASATDLPQSDLAFFPFGRNFNDWRCNGQTVLVISRRPNPYDGLTFDGTVSNEVWRSADGGVSFTLAYTGLALGVGEGGSAPAWVAYRGDPAGSGVWWVSGFVFETAPDEFSSVWIRSADDGLTWTEHATPDAVEFANAFFLQLVSAGQQPDLPS